MTAEQSLVDQRVSQFHTDFPAGVEAFFEGILQGTPHQPSEGQISEFTQRYFPSVPLIPLSSERAEILRQDVTRDLNDFFLRTPWRSLAGDVVYLGQDEAVDTTNSHRTLQFHRKEGTPFLLTGELAEYVHTTGGIAYIEQEEKARLFDPVFASNIHTNITTSDGDEMFVDRLHSSGGQRPLFGENLNDSYGFNPEGFSELLATARIQTGKQVLEVLDIGGNVGLADWQAEQLDTYINVTNLTLEPEPSYYPLRGGRILGIAERMPAEWRERFDAIISNWTFTHMRFPHIALVNAVVALGRGGVMNVDFGLGGHYFKTYDQLSMVSDESRVVFSWLEKLRQQGKITFLPDHFIGEAQWGDKQGETFLVGQVSLTKSESITDEDIAELENVLLRHKIYENLGTGGVE